MSSTATDAIASLHPLDPLTASEVERAWEIVRAQQAPGPRTRVVFIMLHEPAKKVVLGHRAGDPCRALGVRRARRQRRRAARTRRWSP